MKRSEDRILTTHAGSIVRPQRLLDLANFYTGPPRDVPQYEQVLREAVAEVVRRQATVGIDIINDGEFSKSTWSNYVLDRASGFERRPGAGAPMTWLGRDRERFPEVIANEFKGSGASPSALACTSAIRYHKHVDVRRDVKNLQDALTTTNAIGGFLTAAAPASAVFNAVNEFYGSEREYIFAIAAVMREEYLEVYKSGLVVQIDDAVLANMYDHLVQQGPQHYRRWAELRVEALNYALRDIPEDRVRYHICFGSWHLPHVADAPLEDIVDIILQVRAGAYSIEAANPRHEHEWRVWEKRRLPAGKILIPGVITHHIITVEHPQVVADRIVRFAKIVGRENIIAGSDCGFAQVDTLQRVHPSVMWAKYEALVEGARFATAELWGRTP